MANFIKVGDKIINLDNISRVQDNPTKFYSDGGVMSPSNIVVRYLAVYNNDHTDHDRFEGEEADALRYYFNIIASDVAELHRAKLAEDKSKADWEELTNSHAAYLCRPLWQIQQAIRSLEDDEADFKGEEAAKRIEAYIKSYRPDWDNE